MKVFSSYSPRVFEILSVKFLISFFDRFVHRVEESVNVYLSASRMAHNLVESSVTGNLFCNWCGADTKEEFRQPCLHPLPGETNSSLVSQDNRNNGTNSSNSSSSNSSSSNNNSSNDNSKNDNPVSGELKIVDPDGNIFFAFVTKKEVAENLDRLRFMLRASARARWEAVGARNSRFSLDAADYLQRLNYFANKLDSLKGTEAVTWKSTELLRGF